MARRSAAAVEPSYFRWRITDMLRVVHHQAAAARDPPCDTSRRPPKIDCRMAGADWTSGGTSTSINGPRNRWATSGSEIDGGGASTPRCWLNALMIPGTAEITAG